MVNKTKNSNIVAHLSCLTSIVISGLYVKKTLSNDNLDKQKRTTLAINQGAVAVVSAIGSYSLDNLANKQVDKFIGRFTAVNAGEEKIGKYLDGIKAAKSIMIFGLMYRFIAPVLVTPIANSIGNLIEERNEAKLKNTPQLSETVKS